MLDELNAPPDERMFFLIGRGRSGTTLLQGILDAHPSVSVAPEALFIMNLALAYRGGRTKGFTRDVFLEERMRRWAVKREDIEQRQLALPSDASFARRCAEVYEAQADAAKKDVGRLLGDKNPHYALFVDELMELFPRAKFVHLVRDYRDNVLSYRNVPFDLSNVAALADRWNDYNARIVAAAKRSPGRFHRVRFEDLVADPASTLRDICGFLGVAWDEKYLERNRNDREVPEWHRHLAKPIDANLAGRWQNSFSPKQVAIMDRICQPLGRELGYEAASPATRLGLAARAGAAYGSAVTQLERLLFRFPLFLRAGIIKVYRRQTGNVIR